MNNKKKVAVYVDGFNLYHGLAYLSKPHLKWLNLRSLAEKFIDPQNEIIEKIYYFSAVATFMDKETVQRHRTYIEALETFGVEFVAGNFKDKWLEYKNKHVQIKWKKHEEKETDVNISIYMVRDAIKKSYDKFILITNDTDISIYMVRDAIKKSYDKFILITNDTDIVPAVKMASNENSSLQFKLLTPPTLNTHDSLLSAIKPGNATKLTEGHIKNSLLPEKIQKENGKIIHIPKEYLIKNPQ